MARSSYIYTIIRAGGYESHAIIATFTVKHEAVQYWESIRHHFPEDPQIVRTQDSPSGYQRIHPVVCKGPQIKKDNHDIAEILTDEPDALDSEFAGIIA